MQDNFENDRLFLMEFISRIIGNHNGECKIISKRMMMVNMKATCRF